LQLRQLKFIEQINININSICKHKGCDSPRRVSRVQWARTLYKCEVISYPPQDAARVWVSSSCSRARCGLINDALLMNEQRVRKLLVPLHWAADSRLQSSKHKTLFRERLHHPGPASRQA